jgi:EpsD family peptidyl-prolyl cis-trans isomerase
MNVSAPIPPCRNALCDVRSLLRAGRGPAAVLAAVAVASVLAACGGDDGGKKATQVAARVNSDEISVHQINFVLQRTPGIPAERAAEARKEVLERLVDQELFVQRAKESKLDRDPEVMQRLEAARRDVLAKAYAERVAAQTARPDAAEIDKFFASNPSLFAQRRIWRLNEIVLPGLPVNWSQFAKEMEATRTAAEAADLLRRRGIETAVSTNVSRGSETIPLEVLPKFAALKDGEMAIFRNGVQLVIAEIRSSQAAPLDAKQAGPAIEQFITNKRRTEAVQAEVKRVRDSAKIEYRGDFAGGTPPAAPAAVKSGDTGGKAEKGALEKGISGLK